jgi:hypothetical protein
VSVQVLWLRTFFAAMVYGDFWGMSVAGRFVAIPT